MAGPEGGLRCTHTHISMEIREVVLSESASRCHDTDYGMYPAWSDITVGSALLRERLADSWNRWPTLKKGFVSRYLTGP